MKFINPFLIFILSVLIVTACENNISKFTELNKSFDPIIDESSDSLEKLVQSYLPAFEKNFNNKTSTEISTENAVWLVEAMANYNFATEYLNSTNTTVDTLIFPLYCFQNSNGEVVSNLQDIVNLYNRISDSLLSINSTQNYLFIDTKGELNLPTNTAMVHVHTFKVNSYSIVPDLISSSDNWHAGGGEGNCAKQFKGQDALTRIKRHLDWNMYHGFTLNSYGTYMPGSTFFVNVSPLTFYPDSANLLGQYFDPYFNSTPAFGSHYQVDYCITHDRIQTYADFALDDINAHRPVGYEALYAKLGQTIEPPLWIYGQDRVSHYLNGAIYGVPLQITP